MKNYILYFVLYLFTSCQKQEFGSAGRGYVAIAINDKKLDVRLETLYKRESYFYPVVVIINHGNINYLENIKYTNGMMEIHGVSFLTGKKDISIILYDYTSKKIIKSKIIINAEEYTEIWDCAPNNNPPDWFKIKLGELMAEEAS